MINMVMWICYAQSVAYQVYHLSKMVDNIH